MQGQQLENPSGRALSLVPGWLLRATVVSGCALVIGVTIWLVARMLAGIMTVTASVIVAVLLTALVHPLAGLLRRRGTPAWLAALAVVLVTLAVLAGAVTLLVGRAQTQVDDLGAAVADGVERLRSALVNSPLPLSERRLDAGEQQLTDALVSALPTPATGAGIVTEVLSGAALTTFLWFFFLKDGRAMWSWAMGFAPARRAAAVDRTGQAVWSVLTSYVRGTTVVAAVDALGIGLGMFILGVPLWASLTLVVFLGAYVPIVGAFVSGGLAVTVALVTVGPVAALILLGVVLLVQQVEGNVLQPLVMGRALHLHPVGIVLAVTVGALAAGVLGVVVAVPLAAIVVRLADQARGERTGQEDRDAQGGMVAT